MRSGGRRSAWRASTPISAECLVIVFARAPLAGQVKTRIAQRIGERAAARLHERLVRRALHTARAARAARAAVELHVTRPHRWFATLDVPVELQRGADLGERMHHALRAGLRRHARVVLIGADSPELCAADLARADRLLQGAADVVLAPAADGGYALIGARRIAPSIFSAVQWGGAHVLAQTRRNLDEARLGYRLLRTLWDVDRPEDLERLRARRYSSAWRRRARR